jgi:hypothetical protein
LTTTTATGNSIPTLVYSKRKSDYAKKLWNFPLLVVPKKMDASENKKWRICIDFRKLNKVIIRDGYPLPNIQDIWIN